MCQGFVGKLRIIKNFIESSNHISSLRIGEGTTTPMMAALFSTDNLQVFHDKNKRKFFVKLGKDEGVLEYSEIRPGVLDMYHTGVPNALRGKGIAKQLADAAFAYVVAEDLKVKLSCTYLQKIQKDYPSEDIKKRLV